MKRWLMVFVLFILFAIACLYLMIPGSVSINHRLSVAANPQGLYRTLLNEKNWSKWWPGAQKNLSTDPSKQYFSFNGFNYTISDKKISTLIISIADKDTLATMALHVFPLSPDSTQLMWEGRIPTATMPLKRLQSYLTAKQLKKDLSTILEKIESFAAKTEHIYEYPIRQEAVADSILISTYALSKGYPATEFVYQLIDKLRSYIASQSAKETGLPMLNVSTADSIDFLTRVAIPVNKKLKSSGNISYKWMLGGGKILVTEVKGGPYSVTHAFYQMENYITDHRRTTPAISFQSLVTDRRKEPDTSKWITRIFYPVM